MIDPDHPVNVLRAGRVARQPSLVRLGHCGLVPPPLTRPAAIRVIRPHMAA
jgi:hypothetical protein